MQKIYTEMKMNWNEWPVSNLFFHIFSWLFSANKTNNHSFKCSFWLIKKRKQDWSFNGFWLAFFLVHFNIWGRVFTGMRNTVLLTDCRAQSIKHWEISGSSWLRINKLMQNRGLLWDPLSAKPGGLQKTTLVFQTCKLVLQTSACCCMSTKQV